MPPPHEAITSRNDSCSTRAAAGHFLSAMAALMAGMLL